MTAFMPSVLAIVPMRAGSKRLPRKHLRLLGGRPLLHWTLDMGDAPTVVTTLVVSTDDQEIAHIAQSRGAHVLRRPSELAEDKTPTSEVLIHAMSHTEEHDLVVLLQATSPFRTRTHVREALQQLESSGADAIISVTPLGIRADLPRLSRGGVLKALDPDEDLVALNGAIYAAPWDALLRASGNFSRLRTIAFMMKPEDSIDIDTLGDLNRARKRIRETRSRSAPRASTI